MDKEQPNKNSKQAARKRFFEIVDEIQKANKGADYDEVLKDVTEAIKEVRKKRHAKMK